MSVATPDVTHVATATSLECWVLRKGVGGSMGVATAQCCVANYSYGKQGIND